MTSIRVRNLSKSYGPVQALRDVSFEVKAAEIFGLIGPDGAGKTTLFRILATLLLPDAGTVSVDLPPASHKPEANLPSSRAGFTPAAEGPATVDIVRDYKLLRQRIGYMPGRFSLYQDLTVEENLEFFASVFGTTIEENYDLIAPIYVQIEPFKHRRAGALSGGMKQKLALCCALIHKPDFLLLDEPGTGVDPVSRKEFWDMLRDLRDQGLTMLVSTPNMDEATLCDRVALIQHGQVLAIDSPQGIVEGFKSPLLAVRGQDMYRLIKDLRTMPGVADCYAFGEYAHLKAVSESSCSPSQVAQFLSDKGHRDIEVMPTPATIEDCFIELMKS
ncbi:MAG TPA: ABC transporter ATP-binding protein [Saprospiraceae bacterium]|nr:ABC transporter ATP-binding protein [Saprospiraceae bacterium]